MKKRESDMLSDNSLSICRKIEILVPAAALVFSIVLNLLIGTIRVNSRNESKEFFEATVVKSESAWINRNIIIVVPVGKENEKENRITLNTSDSSYMVGDTVILKYNGKNFCLSSDEEKSEYEMKMKEQDEQDEVGIMLK